MKQEISEVNLDATVAIGLQRGTVVLADHDPEWSYINFRDYLNANIVVDKSYEDLKIKLADTNQHGK